MVSYDQRPIRGDQGIAIQALHPNNEDTANHFETLSVVFEKSR